VQCDLKDSPGREAADIPVESFYFERVLPRFDPLKRPLPRNTKELRIGSPLKEAFVRATEAVVLPVRGVFRE